MMVRVLASATIATLIFSLPFVATHISSYYAGVHSSSGMYALGLLLLSLGLLWATELEADSRVAREMEWYAHYQKTKALASTFKDVLIGMTVLMNRGASMSEIREYVRDALRMYDHL